MSRRYGKRELWDELADSYGNSTLESLTTATAALAGIRSGHRVLDVGTGTGFAIAELRRAVGAHGVVIGLDHSHSMLRHAAARWGGVLVAQMDVERLGFRDGAFDVLVASSVLQFVAYSYAALHECHRVLRARGQLCISLPVLEVQPESAFEIYAQVVNMFTSFLPRREARRLASLHSSVSPMGVEAACLEAGFASVTRLGTVTSVFEPKSVDEFIQFQASHGGWFLVRALPQDRLKQMKAVLRQRLNPLAEDGRLSGAVSCVVLAASRD